jgi:hypothetical protein
LVRDIGKISPSSDRDHLSTPLRPTATFQTQRLFVLGELTGLLTFRTEALPTGADTADASDAAPGPAASAPSAPTPEQRIAAATQRRILRGLRDDDVADPADPRNPMAEAVTIIDRHVRTLADELLG